jgi:hypothetical protein
MQSANFCVDSAWARHTIYPWLQPKKIWYKRFHIHDEWTQFGHQAPNLKMNKRVDKYDL